MFTPVLELEGTWEEIAPQLPDFNGHRLRISVEVEDVAIMDMAEEKARNNGFTDEQLKQRLAKFQKIVERTSQIQSTPDTRDWLKEGRAGGMFPDANGR